MQLTKKTIVDNMRDRNQNHKNVIAFENLGGYSVDYQTFYKLVDIYAKGFKELGVNDGDVVTLCSLGTMDTILIFYGLNKIGAVVNFVNPS